MGISYGCHNRIDRIAAKYDLVVSEHLGNYKILQV